MAVLVAVAVSVCVWLCVVVVKSDVMTLAPDSAPYSRHRNWELPLWHAIVPFGGSVRSFCNLFAVFRRVDVCDWFGCRRSASLHEALLNHRSRSLTTVARRHNAAGAGAGAGAGGTTEVSAAEPATLFAVTEHEALAAVLAACDAAAGRGRGEADEVCSEMLDVAALVLEDHPDCGPVLRLLLSDSRGVKPATASIAAVNTAAVKFSQHTWETTVLPFVRRMLGAMGEVGCCCVADNVVGELCNVDVMCLRRCQSVSGSQFDQEVVNLLRECARLFYLNHDRSPSSTVGPQRNTRSGCVASLRVVPHTAWARLAHHHI